MKFLVLDGEANQDLHGYEIPPALAVNHISAVIGEVSSKGEDRSRIIMDSGDEWTVAVSVINLLSKLTQDTYDGVINVSSL